MNIVEPILFQAKYQPEAPALCAPGLDIVSYAQLRGQMNNVARRALASGLGPGSVVALAIDKPLLHAAVILGLSQIGIVPVSVAEQKPPEGLKIDAVISNIDYPFAREARQLPLDFSWIVGDGAPAGEIQRRHDAVCRIVLTAGSTGEPKAVALSHRMVAARNARFDYVVGNRFGAFSRVYLHMGLAAALGYQFLVHLLGRGGTVFFRGDTMENTLRGFAVFQIEALLATPTTLGRFVAQCDLHPTIDIHLDTIISGGSLLARSLAERVRPRLCTHLVTGYGSTETAISATAPAHRIAHIEGAAGYVTPGIRIEIVDETDRAVPPGAEGIVRISSDFAVTEYVDDAAESAAVFRNGWFYPGDIGALTADGLLIISGRQNNVLNAGGDKIAAEKVEAVLTGFPGVSEAAVFMATDRRGVEQVCAAIVCRDRIDTDALRAYCRSRLALPFVPAQIATLAALPVTALGKVDRPRLRQIVLGAGAAVAPPGNAS